MWSGILIPLAPFIMIIFAIWFGSRTKQAQAKHRAEMQKDLLTKFSSAQELSDFLKTDGGKLLMPEPVRERTPARRAGAGILVMVIGDPSPRCRIWENAPGGRSYCYRGWYRAAHFSICDATARPEVVD